ncbi:MAG: CotH kinase family protein [Saprospiraceae bacterium]
MHLKFYLFSLLLLSNQILVSQVVINEYSAANMDGITDNYGEHEDWIELYNAGFQTVDLSGYWLSDNINNPDKWAFPPGVNIEPGEHLLIFASDRDEFTNGIIHAGYKITQTKQEYIVLSDPQQNLLDAVQITTPNQVNHSTGRTTDAAASWGVFQNPTPGGPNVNAYQGYAPKADFDQQAGFYDNAISVVLTAPTGSAIRYTLTGAEPTSTSNLYTNPISISQTTVLKSKVFSDNPALLPSFTEANTYFINETHTVPVISIAGTDLANLLNGTQFEPRGSFEYFDNGELIDEAYGDFNKHGNDSWAYQQRGIDYVTRDQMGYTSSISHQIFPNKERNNFQRLILKAAANDNYPFENGAHIRDAYVHTLSQRADMELDERTYEPCVVYLNGKYWGVYEIREKVDDPDYTRYYYDQGEKWIDYIKTWGGTWEEYGSRADWDVLHAFITNNDMSIPANYDIVKDQLDVLSLIDYMIINTHVVCMDWLNWNTSWWRGRKPDGLAKQWRYALWDMDATFGHYINYTGIPNTTPVADPCYAEDLPSDFEGHGALIQSLMANEEFHSLYVNRYADLNNSFFTCDYMIGLLDSLIERIEPEMPQHIQKWGGSVTAWQNNVQGLKDFILTRCTVIDNGIEDCYDVVGPYPVTVIVDPPNQINKVKVNTFVPASFPYTGDYFGGTTLSFQALPAPDWVFDHWEVTNNSFSPDQFADAIQLALADALGEVVKAVFKPSVPCGNAYDFQFDPTLSSIQVGWLGPSNFISYEFGFRKTGSGDSWNTISVSNPSYTVYGLDVCTEYDIRVRSICDFAIGNYVENVVKTSCTTGTKKTAGNVLEWNVFPNPFGDHFTMDVVLAVPSDVRVEMFDLAGRQVLNKTFGSEAPGKLSISIDQTQDWPQGTYLLRLTTEEGMLWKRLIKG